ncbi:hypothetical protein [Dokdonella sp.]|uniref:hypothetical protein n=1 Tax=Dokdonella sp. TaxID=2291710 RepID=UPI002F407306
MLNRAALIVRPRQPFLDWAAALEQDGVNPDPDGEQTVYLIPEPDDNEEAERILQEVYPHVFENELDSWWTDESAWPQERSFAVFMAWFAVEIHTVIHDLVDDVLEDDLDE